MPAAGTSKLNVLVVDDRVDVRLSARFVLEDNLYQVIEADSPAMTKELLKQHQVDLVLLGMNYSRDTTSGDEGLELLAWIYKTDLGIPAIAMTAWSNVELAVKTMQLGAADFLEKLWKNQRLLQVVAQQIKVSGLKKQIKSSSNY